MKSLFLSIIVIALLSCNRSQNTSKDSHRESPSGSVLSGVVQYKQPVNLDNILRESAWGAVSARVYTSSATMCPFEIYEHATDDQTKDAVGALVNLCERLRTYETQPKDEDGQQFKILSVIIGNTTEGHYMIEVWKTLDNKPYLFSIYKLSIDESGYVLADRLVHDGDCDGIIRQHPGSTNNAVWPSEVKTAYEFAHLPESQRQYANARYLQLASFLSENLRSYEQAVR